MKRIAAILLAIALCLCLFACNQTENEKPEENVQAESTEESSTLETKEETPSTEPEWENPPTEEDEGTRASVAPILYRVTGENGGVLYLFGSIHAADERAVPLPDYVMEAYNESDYLSVECDVYAVMDDLSAQIELAQMMVLTDGTNILSHLDRKTYAKARALLENKGLYTRFLDYYHPAIWFVYVQAAVGEMTDLNSEFGIDMQLLTLAYEEEKEIREVESAESQYEMLLSFSDPLLNFLIDQTMSNKQSSAEETMALYEAWLLGDQTAIEAYIAGPEFESDEEAALYAEYNDILITQRNITMAETAQSYLEEGGTGFFVIGMAHILGDGGCVDFLTQAGYSIEQIKP